HGVDLIGRNAAGTIARQQLVDQRLAVICAVLLLVHGGQLGVTGVVAGQARLADALDLAQVLVVGSVVAIQKNLRQFCLRQTLLAPVLDTLREVHGGKILWVEQVEFDQWQQRTGLAGLGCALQQLGGLLALGRGAAGFARQQLAEARLGTWRAVQGLAIDALGLIQILGLADRKSVV